MQTTAEIKYMNAYCKRCHRTHAAWTRLNDGYICGRCLARDRDPQVKPVSARDAGSTVAVKVLVGHR